MTAPRHLQAVPSADRPLPHDLDAEAAVIASVLIDGAKAFDRAGSLAADEFYAEANRRIWESMAAMRERGEPIDAVTVKSDLFARSRLAQAGGGEYLGQLMSDVPAIANVEAYVRIIRDRSRIRKLIAHCQQFAAKGHEETNADAFFGDVQQQLNRLLDAPASESGRMIGASVSELYQKVSSRSLHRMGSGVSTGYLAIDHEVSGLHAGEVTFVAARPGMGKTSFVLNILRNIAIIGLMRSERTKADGVTPKEEQGVDVVGFFSIEMPEIQITMRLVCIDGGIDNHRLRQDQLTNFEWQGFTSACERVQALPIYIDAEPLDLLRLRQEARKLQRDTEAAGNYLRVIAIDYLQLMNGPGKDENARLTDISKGIKALAKELNIPIVVVCQLNREVEKQQNKRPGMSDLRGSGSLEQDADNIWFVFREDYYRERDAEANGEADIIIAKQRNGPAPKTATLRFYSGCTRFDNA